MKKELVFYCFVTLVLVSCNGIHSKYEIPAVKLNANSEEIIKLLNQEIQNDPDNADMYYRKSSELIKRDMLADALRSNDQALTLDSDNERYLFQRISILLRIRSYTKALEIGMELKSRGASDYASLQESLAEIYFGLKNYETAEIYFQRAIKSKPYEPKFYYRQGELYRFMKDTAKSIYNFKKTLKLNPRHEPAIDALSQMYLARGDIEASAAVLEIFDFQDPENKHFALRRAQLAIKLEDYDLPMKVLNELLRVDSTDAEIFATYGDLKLSQYQYDSALLFSNYSLSIEEGQRLALLTRARVLDRRDQYYSSRNIYQGLVNSDTTDYIAKSELEKLERKIAYLRRIDSERKERASIPLLSPKKIE